MGFWPRKKFYLVFRIILNKKVFMKFFLPMLRFRDKIHLSFTKTQKWTFSSLKSGIKNWNFLGCQSSEIKFRHPLTRSRWVFDKYLSSKFGFFNWAKSSSLCFNRNISLYYIDISIKIKTQALLAPPRPSSALLRPPHTSSFIIY